MDFNAFIRQSRLLDVFLLGPLQIYIGLLAHHWFASVFMIIVGVANIIYNLHNYLYIEKRAISRILPHTIITRNGKTQWHRLYNLVVMYPIFIYVLATEYENFPAIVCILFILDIVIGFAFNLNNYLKYSS
jgi:hypothetical protein